MPSAKRTVLITGCSDGGLGAALAVCFHAKGFSVYATARNVSKMTELQEMGIKTIPLDVLSEESITACVSQLSSLDILINNAGTGYSMPFSDLSISDARKAFDLNVWSCLTVTQAFLPLLQTSRGMIVNNSSGASVLHLPFQATYNASKAAIAMFTQTMRLELEPFGITVVELKTGGVKSNFAANQIEVAKATLPQDSIYAPAREAVESSLAGDWFAGTGITAKMWATEVVKDLSKRAPPPVIYRGHQSWAARVIPFLPLSIQDRLLKSTVFLDKIEKTLGN
jgi:1-acylglycerone phosphate reductase